MSAKGGAEICDNGKDDDGDGYGDCQDQDCNCQQGPAAGNVDRTDHGVNGSEGHEEQRIPEENKTDENTSALPESPENGRQPVEQGADNNSNTSTNLAQSQLNLNIITELLARLRTGAAVDVLKNSCEESCQACSSCDGRQNPEQCRQSCLPCNSCRHEKGELNCYAHQEWKEKQGGCQCSPGFQDCDGDQLTGCELSGQCQSCHSDVDCAPSRCSEDGRRLSAFHCEQGPAGQIDQAVIELSGR